MEIAYLLCGQRCIMLKVRKENTKAQGGRPAQIGYLKFWPVKRAFSPSSSSILRIWLYLAKRSDGKVHLS